MINKTLLCSILANEVQLMNIHYAQLRISTLLCFPLNSYQSYPHFTKEDLLTNVCYRPKICKLFMLVPHLSVYKCTLLDNSHCPSLPSCINDFYDNPRRYCTTDTTIAQIKKIICFLGDH